MERLIALFAPLVPALGLGLAAAHRWRRGISLARPWLWLWLATCLPLSLHAAVFGRYAAALDWLLQLGLCLSASALLTLPKRPLRQGLVSALVILAGLGFVERALSARLWHNPEHTGIASSLRALFEQRVTDYGSRAWRLSPGTAGLELAFDARLLPGELGPTWFVSDRNFILHHDEEEGRPFTRVVTPTGHDPYLMRAYDTEAPLGGRTFRVTLDLRAPEPVAAQSCRGVWLQAWFEGGGHECLSVALEQDWQTYDLAWTVPETARSTVIRIVLNDLDGLVYDVRDVRLFERDAGGWRALEPLVPGTAYVRLSWDGHEPELLAGRGFEPTREWRRFRFHIENASLAESDRFRVTLLSTSALETRNVYLSALPPNDEKPVAVATSYRQGLLAPHPNLSGHTIAATGLTAALLPAPGWAILSAVLTLVGLWHTGSRAAALAAGLGFAGLLWLSHRTRAWLLAAASATGVLLWLGGGLGRLRLTGVAEAVTRSDIWQLGWHTFLQHPLAGVGEDAFAGYWTTRYGETVERVAHAHNLWLHLAASYGLTGLAAALALTLGLLWLGWRRGHWRGLAFVLPILLMNAFDYTLFYPGVLFPLILGLNALSRQTTPLLNTPDSRDNVSSR